MRAASMLFGAAMALQFGLQALGTAVPYQLFLALPYALTLVVLAGFGGQAQRPAHWASRMCARDSIVPCAESRSDFRSALCNNQDRNRRSTSLG